VQPGATAPQPAQPAATYPVGQAAPLPAPGAVALPVPNDPINTIDLGYLRGEAQSLLNELVATLPAPQQSRVAGIPLVVDSTQGDVNAFATCTSSGHAAMAITDGLLDIEAHLSQSRATDEIFVTHKLTDYIQLIVQNQQPKAPIVQPPPGFFAYLAFDTGLLPSGVLGAVLPRDYDYLSHGDIVRLDPQRREIRVLFRRTSLNNSFLVTEQCNHYCLMCSQPPKRIDDAWIADEIAEMIPLIDPETPSIGHPLH